MALVAAAPAVGDQIAAIITAATPAAGTPITPAQLQTMWEQIVTALYTGIVTSSVVAVVSVSGVTPGGGISGPGAGAIT